MNKFLLCLIILSFIGCTAEGEDPAPAPRENSVLKSHQAISNSIDNIVEVQLDSAKAQHMYFPTFHADGHSYNSRGFRVVGYVRNTSGEVNFPILELLDEAVHLGQVDINTYNSDNLQQLVKESKTNTICPYDRRSGVNSISMNCDYKTANSDESSAIIAENDHIFIEEMSKAYADGNVFYVEVSVNEYTDTNAREQFMVTMLVEVNNFRSYVRNQRSNMVDLRYKIIKVSERSKLIQ